MATFQEFVESLPASLSALGEASVVHVTVGNEACDLDSMACALAHAHYLARQGGVVSVPLFQCPRAELPLRPEVEWLFQELSIDAADLVFSGELQRERLEEVGQLSITLVDHHVPTGLAAEFTSAIVEAVDHRKLQEGAGGWPTVLEPVGSCSSLVAERLLDEPSYAMEATVATLLLGAIVLDTVNLRPSEGKVTAKDTAVAERLAPLASIGQDQLFQQLSSARFDIRGLSTAQLLQRDYKQVSVGPHRLGFSSVTALLSDFLQREGVSEDLARFSLSRDLHALVLVGIDLQAGQTRRQIALYQNSQSEVPPEFVDSLATVLEASGELECERLSGSEFEGPLLEQRNTALSRKHILPIIMEFLESLERGSPPSPEQQPPEGPLSPRSPDSQVSDHSPSPAPQQPASDTPTPQPAASSPPQLPHLPESSPGPPSPSPAPPSSSPGRQGVESVSQGGSLDSFVLVQGSEQSPSDGEAAQHGEEAPEPSLDHPNFAVIESAALPEEKEAVQREEQAEEALTPTMPLEHPNFRAAEPSSAAAVLNVSSQSFPLEPTITIVTSPPATGQREERVAVQLEAARSAPSPTIPEYTFREEAKESRTYRHVEVGGEELTVNMTLIQPYRKIIQHAGYIGKEQCAMVVMSACYLPPRSLPNYQSLINQLFFYVLSVLDQLVVDDYVIVYLHSGAPQNAMPSIKLFHRFYKMIDRRLRKQLQHLYLVHPTFWVRTMLQLLRPFISRKFYRKVHSIRSLQELSTHISIDDDFIPAPVLRADSALTAGHPERRYQPKQLEEEGKGKGAEPQ